MVQYAGNPANYPTDFTITSDNTQRAAVTVNVAMEALGDRTAWINARFVNGVDGGSYSGPLTFTNVQGISGSAGINITGDLSCDDITCDQFQSNTIGTALFQMPDGGVGISHTFTPTSFLVASDLKIRNPFQIKAENARSYAAMLQNSYSFSEPTLATDPTHWTIDANGNPSHVTVVSPAAQAVTGLVGIPKGMTITQVRMWYKAGPGHVSMPVNAFRWYLGMTRTNKTTGIISTVIANTADPTASTTTYQQYHSLAVTGLSHVYDPDNYKYNLIAGAEADVVANKPGGVVYGFEIIGNYTVMGEY